MYDSTAYRLPRNVSVMFEVVEVVDITGCIMNMKAPAVVYELVSRFTLTVASQSMRAASCAFADIGTTARPNTNGVQSNTPLILFITEDTTDLLRH